MKWGFKPIRKKSIEWLTNRLLYLLVAIAAIVFVAFWTIGFDLPYLDNPSTNAPLLTGLLIAMVELFVVIAIAVAIWAMIRSVRKGGNYTAKENGINSGRISLIVGLSTVAVLLLTFIVGSSSALKVNGHLYANWFWLKTSDMFVWSSGILLVVAVAAVIFGTTRYRRKRKEGH